ncbi:GNAT family N-acetyltransferase [Ochrobactrum sp. Q0168]|uniref:GNAT family N-acetyltransferase n=1 Tax=Ochrobactrum sp. Q0168 TaxID=2793241 RepID=UPI0018EB42DC|nr:GNAT family N-acetyltransferase [Ochrobactrum sp. Q0168]
MTEQTRPIEVRALTSTQEKRQAFAQFRQAMLGIADIGHADAKAETDYLESGSPLGGFIHGELQGVVNGYEGSVALPGGNYVSHLAVTHVGVAPTQIRNGIARALLSEQLRRAHAQGYVVAGLRASDARIYGRYGYGIASWSVRQEVDLSNGGRPKLERHSDLRIVDAVESFDLFQRIAKAIPTPRAATLSRWNAWWRIQELRTRKASAPHHAAVVGSEGAERGYIRFHIQSSDNWFTSTQRTAIVDDLVAHDDGAWRALIGHLFSQDILHKVILPSRPVDDPLPLFVENLRAVQTSELRDESWIRPLDLHKFLNARSYNASQDVVLRIEDQLISENNGVWTINGEGVRQNGEDPSITLGVDAVSELVFGASSASSLAATGRIKGAPRAIEALDRAVATHLKPHAGISF